MPLLTYWTRLYVLVLLLSLLLMAVISGVWIRVNAYEQRYELLELMAEQLAGEYGQLLETGVLPQRLPQLRSLKARQFAMPMVIQIAGEDGRMLTVMSMRHPAPASQILEELPSLHGEVLAGRTIRDKVGIDSQTWLRVGVPVYRNGGVVGALYVSLPTRESLDHVGRLYGQLALVTATIGLAGWLVLYFLSRKLTLPLRQVASAAQSIARGKYDPALPQQVKERELQQLVVSFQDMASQLHKLERMRSDLLAGVSHELRTPVTSIRGMIQAVKDGVVAGPEAEEFLRISLDEAKRLQRMVEDLLDISSLEAGASPLEREPVSLSQLVEEVAGQSGILPGFEGIRIEKVLPAEPVWIMGDAGRIRQVLLNLLGNSLKASAKEIKVILKQDREFVVIDVEDDGRGIDPEDLPYIFERFYRGGQGKTKARGLGLGLSISRLLARAHGGDLVLLETSPSGSLFRFTLPLSAAVPD